MKPANAFPDLLRSGLAYALDRFELGIRCRHEPLEITEVVDDLLRDHATWLAAGVRFRETPRHESYGRVVVFEDLYGNGWDLIEPAH